MPTDHTTPAAPPLKLAWALWGRLSAVMCRLHTYLCLLKNHKFIGVIMIMLPMKLSRTDKTPQTKKQM